MTKTQHTGVIFAIKQMLTKCKRYLFLHELSGNQPASIRADGGGPLSNIVRYEITACNCYKQAVRVQMDTGTARQCVRSTTECLV